MDNANDHMADLVHNPLLALENELGKVRTANASQARRITELETQLHRATQDRGEVEAKLTAMTAAFGAEKTGRADDVRTWNATYNELVTRTERAEGQLRLMPDSAKVHGYEQEITATRHRVTQLVHERDHLLTENRALNKLLSMSLPVRMAAIVVAGAVKLREVLR